MSLTTSHEKQLSDGNADGTLLGQSTSDLVGFWGATPVAQISSASQTAISASQTTKTTTQLRAELTNAKVLLAEIRANLVTLGIIKGAA